MICTDFETPPTDIKHFPNCCWNIGLEIKFHFICVTPLTMEMYILYHFKFIPNEQPSGNSSEEKLTEMKNTICVAAKHSSY